MDLTEDDKKKKTHIHFFSPREVNVGARHSSNNWPSYFKLLSTIATLSGSYQKKFSQIGQELRGAPSHATGKGQKRWKLHLFNRGDPGARIHAQNQFFLQINNTQSPKATEFGGQIQFKEAKIHWKCSVRKDMEDPVV